MAPVSSSASSGFLPPVAGESGAAGGDERHEGKGKRGEKKTIDVASRAKLRLEASLTGIGLKDWFMNASMLVKDCMDEIEPESASMRTMLDSVYSAAQVLSNENWKRFNEVVWDRIHCQDHEVHGALFAKVEPSWRSMLTTPRGGTTCVFLHLGTEPPSVPLCDLLTKLGWFGVSVCPMKMEPGYEDLIEHHQLDPSHDKDRDEFVAMTSKAGGKMPRPAQFMLAFVNTVFSPLDAEPDSDEELGCFGGSPKADVTSDAAGGGFDATTAVRSEPPAAAAVDGVVRDGDEVPAASAEAVAEDAEVEDGVGGDEAATTLRAVAVCGKTAVAAAVVGARPEPGCGGPGRPGGPNAAAVLDGQRLRQAWCHPLRECPKAPPGFVHLPRGRLAQTQAQRLARHPVAWAAMSPSAVLPHLVLAQSLHASPSSSVGGRQNVRDLHFVRDLQQGQGKRHHAWRGRHRAQKFLGLRLPKASLG